MKETFSINEVEAATNFVELFKEEPFQFENGKKLNDIRVAYQTYGRLNDEGTNAVLICHALTGNAHAAGIIGNSEIKTFEENEFLNNYNKMYFGKPGWWAPLIGPGKAFDTNKCFVVCSNVLGSCYGTTGPTDINTSTGKKYNQTFPSVNVRDMVKVQKQLIDYLNINRLKTISGGSLGGMQALEWVIMYGNIVDSIIPIATSAAHSAWAMGINRASRLAIKNDTDFNNGDYKTQPHNGLSLARQIAMQSYRSFFSFEKKFGRKKVSQDESSGQFEIESYLEHQGSKLVDRFDANTYLYLSEALDNHDVSLGRGKIDEVLGSIVSKTLWVGIDTDVIYPKEEQVKISSMIPNSEYAEIKSAHGHDAFLIEFEQLEKMIINFLSK
jgi:homoserine O-acetyltransferase